MRLHIWRAAKFREQKAQNKNDWPSFVLCNLYKAHIKTLCRRTNDWDKAYAFICSVMVLSWVCVCVCALFFLCREEQHTGHVVAYALVKNRL